MSGKIKASASPLIPKNIAALERLFAIINEQENPTEVSTQAGPGGTVIQATNVQINQGGQGDSDEVILDEESAAKKAEREEKYKALNK